MLREILVDLHTLLATLATSHTLILAGADAQTTALVSFSVGAGVRVAKYVASLRGRPECERTAALAVRSILDRHLEIERIDPVGFGDFMNLRHLAAAAREGRIERLVGYGTARAFRWLSQHDIGDALEAAMRLEKDPTNAEADAVLGHRLGRFPADLAVLEAVRDGRTRDVPPWPGGYAPGTPTLRA